MAGVIYQYIGIGCIMFIQPIPISAYCPQDKGGHIPNRE